VDCIWLQEGLPWGHVCASNTGTHHVSTCTGVVIKTSVPQLYISDTHPLLMKQHVTSRKGEERAAVPRTRCVGAFTLARGGRERTTQ
jgi:hypothetical protein